MCPKMEMFSNFKKVSSGTVLLGDNKACKVLGIGSVIITMFDGISRTLQNVRYVPDLRRNLLSIGMLDNIGCTIKVEGGTLLIYKGSIIVMKGILKNGLYSLIGKTVIGKAAPALTVKEMSNTRLWHLKLGHVSGEDYKNFANKAY